MLALMGKKTVQKKGFILDGIIKNVIIYITTRNDRGSNEKNERRERTDGEGAVDSDRRKIAATSGIKS